MSNLGMGYGFEELIRKFNEENNNDLTGRFSEDYAPEEDRKDVANYGHYFLGSIIISQKDTQRMIIDGQQRLTSLTLLLTYLHNLQKDRDDAESVEDLIFSKKFGERSFNNDSFWRIFETPIPRRHTVFLACTKILK